MNNQLSVIRLALNNVVNPKLSNNNRESCFRMLVDNFRKIDEQVKTLKEIRHQLGEDTSILTKILLEKTAQEPN